MYRFRTGNSWYQVHNGRIGRLNDDLEPIGPTPQPIKWIEPPTVGRAALYRFAGFSHEYATGPILEIVQIDVPQQQLELTNA